MTHLSQLLWHWVYPAMKCLLSILVLVSILFAAVAPAYAESPRGDKDHQTDGARSNPDDNGKGPERNDNDPGTVDADDVDSKPNGKNDNGTGNESDGDCDDNEGQCKAHQSKGGEASSASTPLKTPVSEIVVSSEMTPVSDIVVTSEMTPDATPEATSTDQAQDIVTSSSTSSTSSTYTPPVVVTVVVTETVVVTDVHTVTETASVADPVEPQVGGRMLAAPLVSNCPTCCEARTACCSQPQIDYANTNWLAAVIIFAGLVINGLLRRGRLS